MFFSEKPVVRGALCAFMAFVIWSCGDALTKGGGRAGIPPLVYITTAAFALVLFVSASLLMRKGNLADLKPKRTKLQLIRASFFPIGAYANWTAFTHLPLTTVYIGLFLSPLIISLVGALFLRERLSLFRVLAIVIGFAGVIFSFIPDLSGAAIASTESFWGYVALLVFIIEFVGDMLFLRVLGRTETTESLATTPFLLYLPIIIPLAIYMIPEGFDLSRLLLPVAGGICCGSGYLLISRAYKLAPVSIVSPFHYTQLLTGAALGFVFWRDIPTIWAIGGSVLIVASGLLIAREARNHADSPFEPVCAIDKA